MPSYLETATVAARAAGKLLRENFGGILNVNEFAAHDIKLELDERAQALITQIILERHPGHAILGEEGNAGTPGSDFEWIVDPLDGTVNYFYGIPHFCVSVAVRQKEEILAGVVYDPMREELFATERGGAATLNGRPIAVSTREKLGDAIVSVGLAKVAQTIELGSAGVAGPDPSRPQNPHDGQRGAGSGVRCQRAAGRLHRSRGEPLGRGRRSAARAKRGRTNRDEPAARRAGQADGGSIGRGHSRDQSKRPTVGGIAK